MTARTPETGGADTYYDTNGVERVRIGDLLNGDYGIRVVGPDGTTEIIDGVSDVFRIVATGVIESAAVGTNATSISDVDITTGLTYAPAFLAFSTSLGNVRTMPFLEIDDATGLVDHLLWLKVAHVGGGVTRISLTVNNASASAAYGAGNFDVRYYLLAQEGI